jgi:hypothetical protein
VTDRSEHFVKLRQRTGVAWYFAGAAVLVIVALIGCGSRGQQTGPTPTNDANNLRGIIRYYMLATRDLGRPPQNIDELKATLAGAVEDPSPYFRSNRDGQEYVVVWGLQLQELPLDTILAYERTGAGGKRMVVNLDGVAREVTPEEFAKLKFPKGHTPSG